MLFFASTNTFKHRFFPTTTKDWNDLPDSLIIYAEILDDCVSKFPSRVRSMD